MKEQFYRVFANIPLGERPNPIYVDEKYGAMSWLVLKLEVDHDTEVSKKALQFLSDTQII